MDTTTENPPKYDNTQIEIENQQLPPAYSTLTINIDSQLEPTPHIVTVVTNNRQGQSRRNAAKVEGSSYNSQIKIGIGMVIFAILFMALVMPGMFATSEPSTIGISVIAKYKDLPTSTCMGGQNITNIWYSPPYPFNNTATYSPAEMTFQTFAKNSTGHVIPVYGRVPTVYDHIIRKTERCEDNKCEYRLGDLQSIIYKLQSESNFTCVLDETGSLFSFESKSGRLNDLYRKYYMAKKLYIAGGVLMGLTVIITCICVW